MAIENTLAQSVCKVVETLYGQSVDEKTIQLQATRKEFEGDYTLVVFPFLKISKKPKQIDDITASKIHIVSRFWGAKVQKNFQL